MLVFCVSHCQKSELHDKLNHSGEGRSQAEVVGA